MRRLSRILALLAAIMLVIGGAPAMAETQACNPCPPDCAMMQQMAGSAGDHAKAPAKGKPDNPCKQTVACPASAVAAVAPSQAATVAALAVAHVHHARADYRRTPSWPPDRNLRPPIQL